MRRRSSLVSIARSGMMLQLVGAAMLSIPERCRRDRDRRRESHGESGAATVTKHYNLDHLILNFIMAWLLHEYTRNLWPFTSASDPAALSPSIRLAAERVSGWSWSGPRFLSAQHSHESNAQDQMREFYKRLQARGHTREELLPLFRKGLHRARSNFSRAAARRVAYRLQRKEPET
ncbi:hypothetical protein THAOC_18518 [Thalassiosira oceanica]|uniref:Uncharacterized protein n=1 Tax=Thalassiosira oceanica TaxID=159749 RepID=K0S4J5_THAOC|nr:hypothetical protein THAOC_18518 [Thalassiosira oceanica]|eukprot:EJK61048.1 hypothetical protein THAOC_18518 [Thalassiosira oceanica]